MWNIWYAEMFWNISLLYEVYKFHQRFAQNTENLLHFPQQIKNWSKCFVKYQCCFLTLKGMSENGETYFKNPAPFAARFLKCIWPFWGIMYWSVNIKENKSMYHWKKIVVESPKWKGNMKLILGIIGMSVQNPLKEKQSPRHCS